MLRLLNPLEQPLLMVITTEEVSSNFLVVTPGLIQVGFFNENNVQEQQQQENTRTFGI